jgi:hypothetical protein
VLTSISAVGGDRACPSQPMAKKLKVFKTCPRMAGVSPAPSGDRPGPRRSAGCVHCLSESEAWPGPGGARRRLRSCARPSTRPLVHGGPSPSDSRSAPHRRRDAKASIRFPDSGPPCSAQSCPRCGATAALAALPVVGENALDHAAVSHVGEERRSPPHHNGQPGLGEVSPCAWR